VCRFRHSHRLWATEHEQFWRHVECIPLHRTIRNLLTPHSRRRTSHTSRRSAQGLFIVSPPTRISANSDKKGSPASHLARSGSSVAVQLPVLSHLVFSCNTVSVPKGSGPPQGDGVGPPEPLVFVTRSCSANACTSTRDDPEPELDSLSPLAKGNWMSSWLDKARRLGTT
jgi:hypothetical protein